MKKTTISAINPEKSSENDSRYSLVAKQAQYENNTIGKTTYI